MPAYFFRSKPGAAELRRLARHESGRVCQRVLQRVLMIANLLEGMEHEEAARLAGLSRSAAYQWHNRYEEEGIEGLRDRPRPGRQPRVDAVTSARFKERIVAGAELQRDGVVAFRAVDAQRILKEEFEIDCSLSSTYRLLHRIKLSWFYRLWDPSESLNVANIGMNGVYVGSVESGGAFYRDVNPGIYHIVPQNQYIDYNQNTNVAVVPGEQVFIACLTCRVGRMP